MVFDGAEIILRSVYLFSLLFMLMLIKINKRFSLYKSKNNIKQSVLLLNILKERLTFHMTHYTKFLCNNTVRNKPRSICNAASP